MSAVAGAGGRAGGEGAHKLLLLVGGGEGGGSTLQGKSSMVTTSPFLTVEASQPAWQSHRMGFLGFSRVRVANPSPR